MQKIFYILIFLFFSLNCQADQAILSNSFGVRALGMGGAFLGLSEGPETIFYNYAKPPQLDKFAYSLEYGTILSTPYIAISAQNLFNLSFLRLGYIYAFENNIPYTQLNSTGYPELTGSSFGFNSHALILSTHINILGFNLGTGFTTNLETLEKSSAKMASLGFSINKNLKLNFGKINTAFTIQNLITTGMIWSTGHIDTPPYSGQIGFNYQTINKKLNLSYSIKIKLPQNLKLSERILENNFGFEYWIVGDYTKAKAFALRGGIKHKSLTLGVGLNLNGIFYNYSTVIPYEGYLDVSHYISINISNHIFKNNQPPKLIFKFDSELKKIKQEIANLNQKLKERFAEYAIFLPDYPYGGPSFLMEGSFGIDLKHNLIFLSSNALTYLDKIKVNGKTISANTNVTKINHNFDSGQIVFIFYLKNHQHFLLTLDKAKNNIKVSGYLPKYYQIAINNLPIDTRPDFSFTKYYSLKNPYYLNLNFLMYLDLKNMY